VKLAVRTAGGLPRPTEVEIWTPRIAHGPAAIVPLKIGDGLWFVGLLGHAQESGRDAPAIRLLWMESWKLPDPHMVTLIVRCNRRGSASLKA
jgi:hypothetical protein